MSELNWSEARRNEITKAIDAEIENSRLSHKLIPAHELSATARTVARNRFDYAAGTIDETHDDLVEASEFFSLTKLQTEDEDLANARLLVQRAAQELSRRHDLAVLQAAIRDEIANNQGNDGIHGIIDIKPPFSDRVVGAIAAAVAALDGSGYRRGYALVAGHGVYTELYTRAGGAADLPVKAIVGLLEEGPVHRSGVLKDEEALVLSLSGQEIDRAVAEHPTLEFLRVGSNEMREFRLYERFRARFKQTLSAVLLRLDGTG